MVIRWRTADASEGRKLAAFDRISKFGRFLKCIAADNAIQSQSRYWRLELPLARKCFSDKFIGVLLISNPFRSTDYLQCGWKIWFSPFVSGAVFRCPPCQVVTPPTVFFLPLFR